MYAYLFVTHVINNCYVFEDLKSSTRGGLKCTMRSDRLIASEWFTLRRGHQKLATVGATNLQWEVYTHWTMYLQQSELCVGYVQFVECVICANFAHPPSPGVT